MSTINFKNGDEVQISDKSMYRSQGYKGGEKMRGVISPNTGGWYTVTWDNGSTNAYQDDDLEPYVATKSKAQFKVTNHGGFELNERVIACESSRGFGTAELGEEFIIVEFGTYGGEPGVKLRDAETNKIYSNPTFNDFVALKSIKKMESKPKRTTKRKPTEQPEESVTFQVNGETFKYYLCGTYYNSSTDANDGIFEALGVDKQRFCSDAYGYEHNEGSWPEWREGDKEAPIKIVKAIREKINEIYGTTNTPKRSFEVGERVTYKYQNELPGKKYFHGGICKGGFVGTVKSIEHDGSLYVTTDGDLTYHMLPNEFVEYDGVAIKPIATKSSEYKFKVGDEVVGNEKANHYGITVQGWRGKVVSSGETLFNAQDCIGTKFSGLSYDCFDLVSSYDDPASESMPDMLLEEANRRYPIGTTYKELDDTGKVTGNLRKADQKAMWVVRGKSIEVGFGYVYVNGHWAELASQSELDDRQALLEEAQRRYPIGTKYHAIRLDGTAYSDSSVDEATYECRWVDSGPGIDCGIGYVYANGCWAEIVSQPTDKPDKQRLLEEARRRYPVGCRYRPIDGRGLSYDDTYIASYECEWREGGIDCGIGYVYANGLWADVVSAPAVTPGTMLTGGIYGSISTVEVNIPITRDCYGLWGTTDASSTKQLPASQTPIIMSRSKNKNKIKVL